MLRSEQIHHFITIIIWLRAIAIVRWVARLVSHAPSGHCAGEVLSLSVAPPFSSLAESFDLLFVDFLTVVEVFNEL